MSTALLLQGNQLFPFEELDRGFPDHKKVPTVLMIEDLGICKKYRYHKHKIILIISAMRAYADSLKSAGYEVHYLELSDYKDVSYMDKLAMVIDQHGVDKLLTFEIESVSQQRVLDKFIEKRRIELVTAVSPMFLSSRESFRTFSQKSTSRLQMATFYKEQRRNLKLLLEPDGSPFGGRWSFDTENRKKLPKDLVPPESLSFEPDDLVNAVAGMVEEEFSEHPGDGRNFKWPIRRDQALACLAEFVEERLELFGPYEDAMTTRSRTVFHSALSPLLNLGLILPKEVVENVLAAAEKRSVPIESLEGFLRQIVGWREFVRGVYHNFHEKQARSNFWGHKRNLTLAWYDGTTGLEPLDKTVREVVDSGWAHHIPRLMILSNLMLLCEIKPKVAHDWFMEMFVDASPWVMGPNVYGMGLFSDGGVFSTKPYICGSNYILKMSDYKRGDWCDVMDGLYWRFVDKNRSFFQGSARLSFMPRTLDRMNEERKSKILELAGRFIDQNTN